MPTDGARYSIGDLAGLAGATARTIRYYVAQGLLPPPVGVGPGAHYTDDHLGRLRLIRRLQRQHQPLSEIRQRLAALGEDDVAALVAGDSVGEDVPPPDSALEYLRSVLTGRDRPATGTAAGPASRTTPAPAAATAPAVPSAPTPASMPPPPASTAGAPGPARLFRAPAAPQLVMADAAPAPAAGPSPAAAAAEPEPPAIEQRSQWDRIGLTPNIEIHVRRPLSRLENRRVERLITIARQLLWEEQP